MVKNFKPHAMIDISDGLAQDLNHILAASKVGAIIYADLIPLSSRAAGLDDALYSGEDFELLFTLPPREARKLGGRRPFHFRPIGEIVRKELGLKLLDKKGKQMAIQPKGWRHF